MNEPTLPETATKLVVDWYYGSRNFPKGTKMCQKCDGSGCDKCIKGLKMEGNKAEIYNSTGDLRCPHCELIHMTPENMKVQPGVLNCQKCKNPSIVTKEIARKSNAKASRSLENM